MNHHKFSDTKFWMNFRPTESTEWLFQSSAEIRNEWKCIASPLICINDMYRFKSVRPVI